MENSSLLINSCAKESQVSPQLIAAIILQESKGNVWAIRYEPGFYDRYIAGKPLQGHTPLICSEHTERTLRATSFGLCQIMGERARERGFSGEFLTELFEPSINLRWAMSYFHDLLTKCSCQESALLRYNGGANADYPKEVLAHISSGAVNALLGS